MDYKCLPPVFDYPIVRLPWGQTVGQKHSSQLKASHILLAFKLFVSEVIKDDPVKLS